MIRAEYYAIYEPDLGRVEVFRLVGGRYQLVSANERGHYSIPSLSVELGIWHGTYRNVTTAWLRWWDAEGKLLPAAEERAERLAAKLRELASIRTVFERYSAATNCSAD